MSGTRDLQRISRGASINNTRRDFQADSRLSTVKGTTISFATTNTIADSGGTLIEDRIEAGDLIKVSGSPLNSRVWEVESLIGVSAAVAATGGITFALNPSNNATITLNGTAVTFKTSAGASPEVEIGATLADTLAALLVILEAEEDAELVKFTYSITATRLVLTAATAGTAGNDLTVAASAATVDAATLLGGLAAVTTDTITVLPAMVQTEAAGAAIQIVRV